MMLVFLKRFLKEVHPASHGRNKRRSIFGGVGGVVGKAQSTKIINSYSLVLPGESYVLDYYSTQYLSDEVFSQHALRADVHLEALRPI